MRVLGANQGPAGRRPGSISHARRATRRSRLLALALVLLAACSIAALATAASGSPGGTGSGAGGGTGGAHGKNPYRGNGMWIWYVSRSSGGDPRRIARKAHRHRIRTVYIKSSDGGDAWSQFNRGLISNLKHRGLRVCAWQFVYGDHPSAEAKRGAQAVKKGAECLVIDAESSYEGRYAAADKYIDKLRSRIGRKLPHLARELSLRRLPPRSSVLGLSGARRCPIQPPAGLLARDRRLGRPGVQAHLYLQPRLQAPDRADRPDLRQPPGAPDPALPQVGGHLPVSGGQLVGLAGDRQGGVEGPRQEDRPGREGRSAARQVPDPRPRQQRRPGGVGTGAPEGRRRVTSNQRRLQPQDDAAHQALPAHPRAVSGRQDRPADLAPPASRQAEDGRLVASLARKTGASTAAPRSASLPAVADEIPPASSR